MPYAPALIVLVISILVFHIAVFVGVARAETVDVRFIAPSGRPARRSGAFRERWYGQIIRLSCAVYNGSSYWVLMSGSPICIATP
jgi:hypothetical protein